MLFNFVLVWLYKYFDMSVTDESYVDETRVLRTKLYTGTFDNYLHHWVDATAGGRFVPESITSQEVNTSVLTSILIIWAFL